MTFFTAGEFLTKYTEYTSADVPVWLIEAASEMIFSQIGLIRRGTWDDISVPLIVKNATMEQARFMIEYSIPFTDNAGEVNVGVMRANLLTDYSTLSLRMLANGGYMYRGAPLNQNMGLELPFGN